MQAKVRKDENWTGHNSYNNYFIMTFSILLLLLTRIIRVSTQMGVGLFFIYLLGLTIL